MSLLDLFRSKKKNDNVELDKDAELAVGKLDEIVARLEIVTNDPELRNYWEQQKRDTLQLWKRNPI